MDKTAFRVLEADLTGRRRDVIRIGDRIRERQLTFADSSESIDSMSYQLHNLYSAFEQMFEEVARSFENRVDEGRYHTDLLRRMQLRIEGVRPALLSEETAGALDELRRFRHLFRHAYTAELDSTKVADLVGKVAAIQKDVERDVDRFLNLLRPRPDTN